MTPQDQDELSRFDAAYAPEFLNRPGIATLPDGEHDVQIVRAELTRTSESRELILRRDLLVLTGPARGRTIEQVNFFKKQMSVNALGAELQLLGYPTHEWTAAAGRSFSVELGRALPTLAGLKYRARKTTRTVPAAIPGANPSTYHDLTPLCVLGHDGGNGQAHAPHPQPVPTSEDDELPF